MWWWPESDSRRWKRIESELGELRGIVERAEGTVKALKLEWAESYDKLEHLMARVTKRAAALARERDQQSAQDGATDENSNGRALSPSPALGTHARLASMRSRLFGGR